MKGVEVTEVAGKTRLWKGQELGEKGASYNRAAGAPRARVPSGTCTRQLARQFLLPSQTLEMIGRNSHRLCAFYWPAPLRPNLDRAEASNFKSGSISF